MKTGKNEFVEYVVTALLTIGLLCVFSATDTPDRGRTNAEPPRMLQSFSGIVKTVPIHPVTGTAHGV